MKEEVIEDIGIFQYILMETISGMTSRENYRDSIKDKEVKAVECLAKTKANSSFCHTFVNSFTSCTSDLVENVESCAEPMFVGSPTALVTSTVSQLQFLCENDGEHGFEILNPCFLDALTIGNCKENFEEEISKSQMLGGEKRIFPTICNPISNAKKCVSDNFKKQCQNEITRNTIEELYNASMKPCNEVSKTK
ncbi:hypothetical protein HHI36_008631 [Cryptolaemus montrouzieri]|uniref:DUF19 domain-containing protein n=1 Tax=Cryptolaemus montrouzieri TaxID=559131 RepID=A0ABD2MSX5_9CUCU